MISADLERVLDLVKRSHKEGVKIARTGNELAIRLQKGKKISEHLLCELKEHKASLVEYFNHHSEHDTDNLIFTLNRVTHDTQVFHRATDTELYWVDPLCDQQFKANEPWHGTCLNVYEVHGNLDLAALGKAYRYVMQRHESLRTAFAMADGRVLSRVLASCPDYEYTDLCGTTDVAAVRKLIVYDGHRFDLENGPLLLLRVIRTESDRYIMAIKCHHVIMDTLSEDILFRDLSTAYLSFSNGRVPELPALPLQHKEFLALTNFHKSTNYRRDESYWTTCFDFLPPDLFVPGAKQIMDTSKDRICECRDYVVAEADAEKLNALCQRFSVTHFVALQAVLRHFFARATSQRDLVIGTFGNGRDHPGTEEQIGCYARTILTRAILTEGDPFKTVLQKVQRANDDARSHTAYTLFDLFNKFLVDRDYKYGTFWKINMLYNDYDTVSVQDDAPSLPADEIAVRPLSGYSPMNRKIGLDLQWQFNKQAGLLAMQIQYDSGRYDQEAIEALASGFFETLRRLDAD